MRRTGAVILLGLAAALGPACSRTPESAPHEPVESTSPREVRLTEDALRAAGVEVIAVAPEAFHPHVVASGVIRPLSQKSVVVRSRVAGRVVRILADVGDRVREGAPLATLEGPDVTAAIARSRTANARQESARRALERAERLLDMKAISRAEVDVRRAEAESAAAEAEAAGQDLVRLGLQPGAAPPPGGSLSEFPILAPLSGRVLSRSISPGLLVEREAALFEIADLDRVWAVVDIYEKDLGRIEEQGLAEVRTDAYQDTVFEGRIALVEPALDEQSRTAHVRVELQNQDGRLRPGLFVTVAVPVRGAAEGEATAVPDSAIQKIAGLPAVFVEKGPGLFELRPVEIGREAHGMVEVRHGLEDGERVVAKGAFVLKSELLKETIEGEDH